MSGLPEIIVAGIDPGKTGALSILYPNGAALIFDVPLMKVNGKEMPAWSEWAATWSAALALNPPDMIVLEKVAARPNQGVSSMFKFGQTLGFVHGIAACATKAPLREVTPNQWKGKLGLLNSDKSASREKVRTLFPKIAHAVTRVKDDGRAEATLLAFYGRQYLA